MPKLKCPTPDEVQSSIESLWRHVEEDYVTCHREAAKWSNKSIEQSQHYKADSHRRAKPILKYIKYRCQQADVRWHVDAVHMIDHSKNPPEIAPYIVCKLSVENTHWATLDVKFYKPETFADIEGPLEQAFAALDALRN